MVYSCQCWLDLADCENPHWGFLRHLPHLDQIHGCVHPCSRGEKPVEEKVKLPNFSFSKPPFNLTTDVDVSAWSDLKFVTTVATSGHVKFFQLCKFFQKTTHFLANFLYKYEIHSFIWQVYTHFLSKTFKFYIFIQILTKEWQTDSY